MGEDLVEPGEDVKAYVTCFVWLLARDELLADQLRAETLQFVSPQQWNAACDELREYAERQDGVPPRYERARVDIPPAHVVRPPTVKRLGDPRGGEATWTLLPAPEGVCSQCATDHDPDEPHNQQSLYYQYAFHVEHDRWPTWQDAMDHCTEEVQERWKELLAQHGIQV